MEEPGYHPDLPAELEQAWRAAHLALEPAAASHLTFVPESELADWFHGVQVLYD